MKILLTGGAGFIASHVTDAYIKAGHKVVIIDNLSSGSRKNLNPKAKFYKADIRNLPALLKIFKKEKPDAVNHHAAFISVTDSVKRPRETFDINAGGTLNVLLAAMAVAPKKFLFSSTGGAIYGNPKKLPADESTPANPLSPYAVTKLMDEKMIEYFCGAARIPYLIFRYANVYGPRQHSQGGAGVFPIFINGMRHGRIPIIFGDGKKTRDYVYVEDVARANLLGLAKGENEIINIACNREISDDEIANALAHELGFRKGVRHTPPRKGEVKRIRMSYAKAEKVLGWKPKVEFEEGVRKTVNYSN
jgi:UDP-glucose 4-epimerase